MSAFVVRARDRGRLRDERAMTLVEVTIALFLLALGVLATLRLLDASITNTARAEQSQVAVNIAERELEAVRSLSYSRLALTTAPGTSADPLTPLHRVSGANFALNRDGTDLAQLAVNGVAGIAGGTVDPGPTPFESGDVSGEIYRFVVWRDDPEIPGSLDFKRITVAVRVTEGGTGSDRGYFEVQSDVIDPSSGTSGTGAPPTNSSERAVQSYWLSDTQDNPCNRTRQPITANHAAHNTTGGCGGGSAYDNMYRNPPPRDPGYPTLFNYATDVNGAAQGRALLKQTGTCTSSPELPQQVHTWRTPTLNLNVAGPTTNPDASLHIWTRLPAQSTAGELCVILERPGLGLVVPVNATLSGIANANCAAAPTLLPTHFRCTAPSWPTTWTEATINLNYIGVGVVNRLQLSLTGHHTGNPNNLLQLAYDHPLYPSRLDIYPVL